MIHTDTYRIYYDAIIERMTTDVDVEESISNLDIEQYARVFESVCFNGVLPQAADYSFIPYTWELSVQFNNDNFKFIVNNYSTSDVLKIILFKSHNSKYNDSSINLDHTFILDLLFNPIRIGDTIVGGYLSSFKVEAFTKSFKIRVTNPPGLKRSYKYYHPLEVLRLVSNTLYEN